MLLVRKVSALLFLAALVACNPMERAEDAQAEVRTFHARYNAGDVDALWRNLAPEFKQATSRTDFDNLIATISNSLGKLDETEQVGININSNMNGSFTVVTMRSTFEQGEGIETFTFRSSDDRLGLVGYHVNSPKIMSDLMAKGAERSPDETRVEPVP